MSLTLCGAWLNSDWTSSIAPTNPVEPPFSEKINIDQDTNPVMQDLHNRVTDLEYMREVSTFHPKTSDSERANSLTACDVTRGPGGLCQSLDGNRANRSVVTE